MARTRQVITERFDSIEQFEKCLAQREVNESHKLGGRLDSQTGTFEFTGTWNYDEANNLLKYGDKESLKKLEQLGLYETRTNIRNYKQVRRLYNSPVGFAANVPAYISGSPNSMINFRVEKQRQSTVTILWDATVPYYTPKADIFRTAAQFMSAVMILEAKGIRVNIWVGCASTTSSGKGQIAGAFINVKRAERKLDLLRLVYPVTSPSFLRRHFLRWEETMKGVGNGTYYKKDEVFEIAAKKARVKYDKILRLTSLIGDSAERIVERICN